MPSYTLKAGVVRVPFEGRKGDVHEKILTALMNRKRASLSAMSGRAEQWQKVEDSYQFYVRETELDSRLRGARETGIPTYTTIHVPYSYAVMLTAHTYLSSVFLSRNPVFQMQGRNAAGQDAERAVEALLEYQMTVGQNLVPLYMWLHDVLKYGEGTLWHYWDVDKINMPESFKGPRTFLGVPVPGSVKTYDRVTEVIRYQGSRLLNVRPQDAWHDPSVTKAQLQRGEFVGRTTRVPFNMLRRAEIEGTYFNIDEVKQQGTQGAVVRETNQTTSVSSSLPGTNMSVYQAGFDPFEEQSRPVFVDLDEVVIELVPNEWPQLPRRDNLEKWVFTVANEHVIVGCQPLGLAHNYYPTDVIEYEFEPYNISKRGMLEMLEPLNVTLDWLINTHFYSVRRALNDEFIYDPSILMRTDVERPGPGKLIRVRPDAFGKDISKAFAQLQTVDVTQNHLRDVQLVLDMMNRVGGVNDNVMGVLSTNRKTATEVRTSSSFAVNRLKILCEYISAMGFAPLASKLVANSQQLLEGSIMLKLVGEAELMQNVQAIKPVDRASIAGFFDFVPVDGTLPIDRMAQTTMIGQLTQQFASIPQMTQGFDFMRLYSYLLNLNGVKNVQNFRIQVMPDAQVAAQTQAGNLVPAQNVMNNAGVQTPGGA